MRRYMKRTMKYKEDLSAFGVRESRESGCRSIWSIYNVYKQQTDRPTAGPAGNREIYPWWEVEILTNFSFSSFL